MKIVIQGVHCEIKASNLIVNAIGCNNQAYYYCSTTENLLTIQNLILCVHTLCKQSKQPVASY